MADDRFKNIGRANFTFSNAVGSTNSELIKGFVGGVASDPLVNLALSPFIDKADREKLQAMGDKSMGGHIGQMLGGISTVLIPGFGVHKAGMMAGRALLPAAAKSFGTVGAVPLKGFTAGFGASKAANKAMRNASRMERVREQIGAAGVLSEARKLIPAGMTTQKAFQEGIITADMMSDLAKLGFKGQAAKRLPFDAGELLAFERAFEIGGANMGLGVFEFARQSAYQFFEDQDYVEAARQAALLTLFGLALEGGITAATRFQQFEFDPRRFLSLERQFEMGLIDEAGNSLSSVRGVPTLKNPLFALPQGSSAQLARVKRAKDKLVGETLAVNPRSGLEKATLADERAYAKEEWREFTRILNATLAGPAGKALQMDANKLSSAAKMGKPLTVAQVKKIHSIDDILEAKGAKLHMERPQLGKLSKQSERLVKKLDKQIERMAPARRIEAQINHLLELKPNAAYLDLFPGLSGSLEGSFVQQAMKIILTPEGVAKKYLGPMGGALVEQTLKPAVARDVQHRDVATKVVGDLKARMAKTLNMPSTTAMKKLNETKVREKILDLFESYERYGTNRARVITELRKKTDWNGDKITARVADEIFDNFEELRMLGNRGFKSPINIPGREQAGAVFGQIDATDVKMLEGFDDLLREAPDVYASISPDQLARQIGPEAVFFPHHFRSLRNRHEFKKHLEEMFLRRERNLAKARGEKFDVSKKLAEFRDKVDGTVSAYHFDGMPFASSLDWQRHIGGTLREKYLDGFNVIEDPYEIMGRYLYQLNHRLNFGRIFGFTKAQQRATKTQWQQLIGQGNKVETEGIHIARVNALERQTRAGLDVNEKLPAGFDPRIFNESAANIMGDIIDASMGMHWEDEAFRKAASIITSMQVASKLTMATFANMTQTGQTAAFNNIRNTARSLRQVFTAGKMGRENIARGIGAIDGYLTDHNTHAMQSRPFQDSGVGAKIANFVQDAADLSLSVTGFRSVERYNRMIAGQAAYQRSLEMIMRGVLPGKQLRGKNLEIARRQAKQLGFNLDDMIRKVDKAGFRAGPEGLNYARWFESPEGVEFARQTLFNGMQTTQFVVTNLNRPTYWNTPLGRVIFQFKTFGLQQYRFMRDQVLHEATRGNMAPLATTMGIAPVAGEFVGDIREWLKDGKIDKGSNGIARYMQNMMYTGALGIVTDVGRAMSYEQGAEALLGPTASDFIGMAEQLTRGNIEGVGRDITRQPFYLTARGISQRLYQVGEASGVTAEDFLDYFNTFGEDETPSGRVFSAGVPPRKR